MRKIVLHNMVTLDGCVSGPNGELDFLFDVEDPQREAYVARLYDSMEGILVGRETYLACADWWPKAAKDVNSKERAFARRMNEMPKYVFSKTLAKVDWENSELIKGDVAREVGELKHQPGGDLVLIGGVTLVRSFLKLDLIDEFHLIVHPIVLGKGKRLFDGLERELKMILAGSETFDTGVVALHYKRA